MKLIQGLLFSKQEKRECEPLSSARQALALKWRGYACKLARQYARCYGGDVGDWESEALEALCIAASKFDSDRPSVVVGKGNFCTAVWYRVRSHLNAYKRRRDLCGLTYVPRDGSVGREEFEDSRDHRGGVVNDEREVVSIALEALDGREFDMIRGLYSRSETLETVGRKYDVSKQRVRQIKEKALDKMRQFLKARGYVGCN